jgi:transposase
MKRDDRKTTAKMLAAKGLSTREIAALTGWDYTTISRDLKSVANATKSVANATPSTTGGRTRKREEIAEAAAEDGHHR